MEVQNLVVGWKSLDISGENGPVKEWRPLIVPGDDKKEKVIGNYGYAEKNETSEMQLRFAKAVAEVVIERYRNSKEIRVMDVSANDLNVTLAFCEDSIDMMNQNGEDPKKMLVWANDLSYKSDLGLKTELARRAELSRQVAGEVGAMIQSPLISKRAEDVVEADIGNNKLDVIWDRLGAMWHTIGERDLEKAKLLLERYGGLLKKGGLLFLDGVAPGTGTGFDTDKRLQLLLADNNLDDGWYAQLGFSLEYETKDGQKLMILKKA